MDVTAMMGGGVCWIDIDNDGWLDLFAVNSYADDDLGYWQEHGGMPRSAPLPQRQGHGSPTSAARPAPASSSAATAASQATSTATASPTSTSPLPATTRCSGTTATGHFSEGARAAGITAWGWHAGAAVADVNGDGRPDIFVAGYADVNAPGPPTQGFPNNYKGVRDLLYLNTGNDAQRPCPVPRGRRASCTSTAARPSTGSAPCSRDVNGDGRPDLYVANDANPNRLYLNVPCTGGAAADPLGLGFRLEESAASVGLADPNAGMGIAAADYSGDGRPDSSSRTRTSSSTASSGAARPPAAAPRSRDARADIASAFDTSLAGWGVSWVDLDNDTNLDLVLANGAIPVIGLEQERGARAGVREPDRRTVIRASSPRRRRRVGLDDACPSTAAGSRPRTSTTTARRSRRQHDRRQADAAPQHGREGQLARGRARPASRPAPSSPPCSRTAAASCRRSTPAAATSPPRIPAPTSGSGRRRAWTS